MINLFATVVSYNCTKYNCRLIKMLANWVNVIYYSVNSNVPTIYDEVFVSLKYFEPSLMFQNETWHLMVAKKAEEWFEHARDKCYKIFLIRNLLFGLLS
jgi:hypothetical protein